MADVREKMEVVALAAIALVAGTDASLAAAPAATPAATTPSGQSLLIERFVRADGAISVTAHGNFIDPYFANKALITALEAGLEVTDITRNWLTWLLPRQRDDGGFDRFCAADAKWINCRRADADDSTMATFLQLNVLFRRVIRNRSDERARTSLDLLNSQAMAVAERKAGTLLQQLRTPRGSYRVFANEPVEYLMDNAEVYSSLVAVNQPAKAEELKQVIRKFFFAGAQWLPSNQPYEKFEFYPSALASTYRWHTGLATRDEIETEFNVWSKRWGAAWLAQTHDEYAWGLVAWGARGVKDQHWLRCWRHLHAAHDRSRGWTVLDEAVDAGLAHLGIQAVAQSCDSLRSRK